MDIEDIFTLQLKKALKNCGVKLDKLADAVEETDETGYGPAKRTIRGYLSGTTKAKRNAGLQTLQALTVAFKQLGYDIDEADLIARGTKTLTGTNLKDAVKFLAIGRNDIEENDLKIFFDVFNKLGADNMLAAADIVGSELDETSAYLKLAKFASNG